MPPDSDPWITDWAPIFAIVGAVLVAFLTAATTDLRQRRQLRHERDLLDLADLRQVLEEAFTAIEVMLSVERRRWSDHSSASRQRQKAGWSDSVSSVRSSSSKLLIRLGGESDPLYAAWHELTTCAEALRAARAVPVMDPLDPVPAAESGSENESPFGEVRYAIDPTRRDEAEAGIKKAYPVFVALAKERVGSRLP